MAALLLPGVSYADNDIKDNEFNPVHTGVTTLGITPDARGSAMGNLGAATDPDINSQFWNPSKYAFAYSNGGLGISYTPWLRKLVNDIFLADLSGYMKLGSGDNQALSASFRYFSLGEVTSNDDVGTVIQTINPYELSFDVGYSRKLSESFLWAWCSDIYIQTCLMTMYIRASKIQLLPHLPPTCLDILCHIRWWVVTNASSHGVSI